MDADDCVPLLGRHVHEHAVAQDARVVDQDVEPAEGLDRGVDEALRALPIGDAVAVRHGLATHRLDLVDDVVRGTSRLPGAVHLAAEVVHDDLCTVRRQHQRVLATDAPAGARDDRDSSLTQPRHPLSPL